MLPLLCGAQNDFKIYEIVKIEKPIRLEMGLKARALVWSRKGNRYQCIVCDGRRRQVRWFHVDELKRWKNT